MYNEVELESAWERTRTTDNSGATSSNLGAMSGPLSGRSSSNSSSISTREIKEEIPS